MTEQEKRSWDSNPELKSYLRQLTADSLKREGFDQNLQSSQISNKAVFEKGPYTAELGEYTATISKVRNNLKYSKSFDYADMVKGDYTRSASEVRRRVAERGYPKVINFSNIYKDIEEKISNAEKQQEYIRKHLKAGCLFVLSKGNDMPSDLYTCNKAAAVEASGFGLNVIQKKLDDNTSYYKVTGLKASDRNCANYIKNTALKSPSIFCDSKWHDIGSWAIGDYNKNTSADNNKLLAVSPKSDSQFDYSSNFEKALTGKGFTIEKLPNRDWVTHGFSLPENKKIVDSAKKEHPDLAPTFNSISEGISR